MEQNVAQQNSSKSFKKVKRWTLLLVNNYGKIVSIEKFKGLIYLTVVIIAVSMIVNALLYFSYRNIKKENKNLIIVINDSERKIVDLHDEKETLIARFVTNNPKIKSTHNRNELNAVKENDKQSIKKSPEQRKNERIQSLQQSTMEVEKLSVFSEPAKNTLRVQFKLMNNDASSNSVAGYTFVILKCRKNNDANWLIMPFVNLVDDKPNSFKKGQYFSIFRYKTVKFKARYTGNLNRFTSATVFVYTEKGSLALEKDFQLGHDGMWS